MKKLIYLDAAATSLHRPESVEQAVLQAMRTLGNSGRGTSGTALDAARMIYGTREKIADLFHYPQPERVAFTKNSTEALNMAILGLFAPGEHVITTVLEHNSVLRPLYHLQQAGLELTVIPCDEQGYPDYAAMEQAVRKNTKGIVCTHASNLTGNLVDVHRVGTIARNHGLIFVLDASQSAGVFPIDMEEDHIDVVCFTGHKSLMGPQGTGGLCVKKGIDIRPLCVGGSGIRTFEKDHPKEMPVRLEAGTLNAHGLAGLHAGLEYIQEKGLDGIRKKEQALARTFYEGVKTIPGIKFYGDFSTWERAPIVALNFADYDSAVFSDELMEGYNIATRAGGHCAPLMHEFFGTVEQGAVRFSFSCFNRMEEIETAVSAVRAICREG